MPPKRKLTLGQRGLIYRYPNTFIILGVLIGITPIWGPIIYSLTHSEEEINRLKGKTPFLRT